MKKHIFGFAIFSVIIVTSVFVYAFFYAPPVPPIEAVKPPVLQKERETEKTVSCAKKTKDISFEVLSSSYDAVEGRFVSKLRLKWHGRGNPPQSVYIKARLFDFGEFEKEGYISSDSFIKPFENGNETVVTFNKVLNYTDKSLERNNLYALFDVSNFYSREHSLKDRSRLTEATSVLSYYGKNSDKAPELKLSVRRSDVVAR